MKLATSQFQLPDAIYTFPSIRITIDFTLCTFKIQVDTYIRSIVAERSTGNS